MNWSETFLQLYEKYLGTSMPEIYNVNDIRLELEILMERANSIIQKKIGCIFSKEDIIITKEENNNLYEANLLYNEFMDFHYN